MRAGAPEANYSYRLIHARALRGADVLKFRAIELAMFFILLKIGGYAGDRWADVLADIQTWPRSQRAQTPHEYDATLGPNLPEAQQEMTLLTRAFVEARYSRHAFDRERARRVRAGWQQVKAALRALRRTR